MAVTNFGWDVLGDNVLMETDQNGAATVQYTNEPRRFGAPVTQKRGVNSLSYFHFDGDGSTRQLSNSGQTVTDSATYNGYGNAVSASTTTSYSFRYKGVAGYYTDEPTGGIYVRARSYMPSIGRWLSADPLGFAAGINLYAANFVPSLVDPSGFRPCTNRENRSGKAECGSLTPAMPPSPPGVPNPPGPPPMDPNGPHRGGPNGPAGCPECYTSCAAVLAGCMSLATAFLIENVADCTILCLATAWWAPWACAACTAYALLLYGVMMAGCNLCWERCLRSCYETCTWRPC